jgi:hypothetical protein
MYIYIYILLIWFSCPIKVYSFYTNFIAQFMCSQGDTNISRLSVCILPLLFIFKNMSFLPCVLSGFLSTIVSILLFEQSYSWPARMVSIICISSEWVFCVIRYFTTLFLFIFSFLFKLLQQVFWTINIVFYYILINYILRNIDEIKCVVVFPVFWTIFNVKFIFHWCETFSVFSLVSWWTTFF